MTINVKSSLLQYFCSTDTVLKVIDNCYLLIRDNDTSLYLYLIVPGKSKDYIHSSYFRSLNSNYYTDTELQACKDSIKDTILTKHSYLEYLEILDRSIRFIEDNVT